MEENLFDYGQLSQIDIIKPYTKRVQDRIKSGLTEDFRRFFMNQLKNCVVMIGELECRPNWVIDIPKYRMRSEIVVFLTLFSVIDTDDLSDSEKEQIEILYREVRDFGEGRDWDLHILHIQFIRSMGNNIQNFLLQLVLPRELEPIDYN